MTKIKEYRICENGDFDILVSFSKEDIDKLGIDTTYHALETQKDNILRIWHDLRREISENDKRTLNFR